MCFLPYLTCSNGQIYFLLLPKTLEIYFNIIWLNKAVKENLFYRNFIFFKLLIELRL